MPLTASADEKGLGSGVAGGAFGAKDPPASSRGRFKVRFTLLSRLKGAL